ncbi:Uncharacterised protein [Propionibacterium australiense]|uniref:ATP/GTP-binding protein n=2 Tax=Propionibacterium australiense TaxID=119981 RepID=A0A383S5M4_9ACTN|nr:Hypothetical protein PROPAUS_1048 [Propionibacterium australiense]VEH89149.1 Uncharacterised protein [Propionibacterium australiense]
MRGLRIAAGVTVLVAASGIHAPTAHACDGSGCMGDDNYMSHETNVEVGDSGLDYSVSVSESYQAPGADNASDYGPMTGTPGQAPVGPAQPQDTQPQTSPDPGTRPDGSYITFNPATTADTGQPGAPAPRTDPATIARRAIATLPLDEPGLLLDPDPTANEWAATAVGFHTWFHAPKPDTRHTSITHDGITIDITANPGTLHVDTGDRQHQTCRHTVPYQNPIGVNKPSPYCGHTWDQPGDYTITATRTWHITWTANGHTGTDTTTRPAGTHHITVIELSSILTNPNQ